MERHEPDLINYRPLGGASPTDAIVDDLVDRFRKVTVRGMTLESLAARCIERPVTDADRAALKTFLRAVAREVLK